MYHDVAVALREQAAQLDHLYKQFPLLDLTKEMRDRIRVWNAAIDAHETYRQAGYDDGYGAQYRFELDKLADACDAARKQVDWFDRTYVAPRIDGHDRQKLYRIAERYA